MLIYFMQSEHCRYWWFMSSSTMMIYFIHPPIIYHKGPFYALNDLFRRKQHIKWWFISVTIMYFRHLIMIRYKWNLLFQKTSKCYEMKFILIQSLRILQAVSMMTSSNGNIFRVTGHLCGEFTGPRWLPRTKASDAELWCFLWSTSEQTVK